MTTYVSFADADNPTSPTSQAGNTTSSSDYSQFSNEGNDGSVATQYLYGAEEKESYADDDESSVQVSVLSDIEEQPIQSHSSSTIWDGIDDVDDGGAGDLELSTASCSSSSELGGVEADGRERSTAFSFSFRLSEETTDHLDVVDLDEASTGSNASLTPTIGANSIRTLETELASLKGLLLLEDEPTTFALLLLPPPPPPPGPPPLQIQELYGKPRVRTCSSTTSESTDHGSASSISEPGVSGEDMGTMTDNDVDTDIRSTTEVEERATMPDEQGKCTADVEGTATMTDTINKEDQATMTVDAIKELNDKGTATDGLKDELRSKGLSFCLIAQELVLTIEHLSAETSSTLGRAVSSKASLVGEDFDIDPLAPPSVDDITTYIDSLRDVAAKSTNEWKASLKRVTIMNHNFHKEQRRWRRENNRLRDEVRHLKMQAAESVSQNELSASALREDNARLKGEVRQLKIELEAAEANRPNNISAIELATVLQQRAAG